MTSATTMVALVSIPSAASDVRKVRVSLPRIECLLDGRKYFDAEDLPPLSGTDLRSISRPKLHKFVRPVKGARPGMHEPAERLDEPV